MLFVLRGVKLSIVSAFTLKTHSFVNHILTLKGRRAINCSGGPYPHPKGVGKKNKIDSKLSKNITKFALTIGMFIFKTLTS